MRQWPFSIQNYINITQDSDSA